MRLDRLEHETKIRTGVDRRLGVQAVAERDERFLGSVVRQSVQAHPQLLTLVIREQIAR